MLRQLERKFKRLPRNYHQKLQQANAELLLQWAERILDAKTLDEVFK